MNKPVLACRPISTTMTTLAHPPKGLCPAGDPDRLACILRPAVGNVVLAALTLAFLWKCYYPGGTT